MCEFEFRETAKLDRSTLSKTTSPYERMITKVKEEGEFYTYPEVCEMLGVSQPTVRKVTSDPDLEAPSKYVSWGRRHVWLFTKKDVEETAKALRIETDKLWA